MIPYQLIWAIMLLPLAAFILNGLVLRLFVPRESRLYGYVAITAIGASAVFSVWTLIALAGTDGHQIAVDAIPWLTIENFSFSVGIIADQLSVVMATVVSVISLMVQIYSLGYMHGDEAGYYRGNISVPSAK